MKLSICMAMILISSCQTMKKNIYDNASKQEMQSFKKVILPFLPGTQFKISQGAFGSKSHHEIGNEYSWDFDVPFGTPVAAVEAGKVFSVWQPDVNGGCESKFSNSAHNIKIEHSDGTIAQYVHIQTDLKEGTVVTKEQVIASTAKNGWICQPQLHFGIYASKNQLYESPNRKTIPLVFENLPEGVAKEGLTATTVISKIESKVKNQFNGDTIK